MAFIELLGAEHELNEKAQKRAEARTKKREELAKQLEERRRRSRRPQRRGLNPTLRINKGAPTRCAFLFKVQSTIRRHSPKAE